MSTFKIQIIMSDTQETTTFNTEAYNDKEALDNLVNFYLGKSYDVISIIKGGL